MNERKFKGIWIPATLWLSQDLSIQEKAILAEIDSLEDDTNGCFASNKYFANFFGLSETRISHIITDLNKKGYTQINKYNKNGKTVREMRLNRPPYPMERVVKNDHTDWSKMTTPTSQKRLPYNIVDNKEDIKYIVEFLNSTTGSSYKYTSKSTQSKINARLQEGFTIDDFKTVIIKKCNEWKGTDFEIYLRPDTLFSTKFESYLNQKSKIESKIPKGYKPGDTKEENGFKYILDANEGWVINGISE